MKIEVSRIEKEKKYKNIFIKKINKGNILDNENKQVTEALSISKNKKEINFELKNNQLKMELSRDQKEMNLKIHSLKI